MSKDDNKDGRFPEMPRAKRQDDLGNVTQGRLLMAQEFVLLLLHAYDAQLYHGVNYRTLREYKDHRMLDKAATVSFDRGVSLYVDWLRRLSNAITAAVNRKQLRLVRGGEYEDDGGPTIH